MKLPIKKKYFDQIKKGIKKYEIRDGHITFICEETGESLLKYIENATIIKDKKYKIDFPDVISEESILMLFLK
jgi:hypothetical protein